MTPIVGVSYLSAINNQMTTMIDALTTYRFRSLEELLNDWKPGRITHSATVGKSVVFEARLKPFVGSLHPFNILTEEIYGND